MNQSPAPIPTLTISTTPPMAAKRRGSLGEVIWRRPKPMTIRKISVSEGSSDRLQSYRRTDGIPRAFAIRGSFGSAMRKGDRERARPGTRSGMVPFLPDSWDVDPPLA